MRETEHVRCHHFIVQTSDGSAISSKNSREKVTVDMLHVYMYVLCIIICPIVVDCRKTKNHRKTINQNSMQELYIFGYYKMSPERNGPC